MLEAVWSAAGAASLLWMPPRRARPGVGNLLPTLIRTGCAESWSTDHGLGQPVWPDVDTLDMP